MLWRVASRASSETPARQQKLANRGKDARIGRRVGTRGAPDRALVDIDHFISVPALNIPMRHRFGDSRRLTDAGRGEQRVVNQRRFTGTRRGDTGKQPTGSVRVTSFQVVAARAPVRV